jgi:hypothetical protein
MKLRRRPFCAAAGWSFARAHAPRLGSFRQNAPRSRVPGAAQHEVVRCRPGTVDRALGGPGSAMHYSLTLALHRIRDTQQTRMPLLSISRYQTAQLVPAARFLRPGLATLLRSPESRGGRSAERRSGASGTRAAYHDAIRQALARRLASHDAANRWRK